MTIGLGGWVVTEGGAGIVKELRQSKPEAVDTRGARGLRRSRKELARDAVRLRDAGFDEDRIGEILGMGRR